MSVKKTWVYSDPKWWIDQIATVCTPEFEKPQFLYPVDEYFTGLKDRLAGTLRYLSAHRNLSPYEVRRSLFYAKALKKWKLPLETLSASDRASRALDGFVARNDAADADAMVPQHADCMRYLLKRWLPEIPTEQIHGKFGPGAVAEGWKHPQRFCRLYEWIQSGAAWDDYQMAHRDRSETVARLCAVPKDWDKDRLITVEPCFGSYVEQLVRSVLLESIHVGPLQGTAMDLGYTDGQAMQRRLALEASRTGRRATIDLSDASDSVSWAAVQAVFPEWVLDLLWASRSYAYSHKTLYGGTPQRLKMFAGMGNATTFVVETLFFSAYAVAVQMARGAKRAWVSTFGDDIIVSSDACEWLLDEGVQPFFQINRSKSFFGSDAIRESCGVFCHSGNDVTVPKVDGYPETYQGACGVADLHWRLVNSRDDFQVVLAHQIAATGLLQNWPFLVDGHPSISDWSAEFSALPKTRHNARFQTREAYVEDIRCQTKSYPTVDHGGLDDDWSTPWCGSIGEFRRAAERDIAERRRRELDPPADVWYQARLLGCLNTDPLHVTRERDVARYSPKVSFPTGKVRSTMRWGRVLPPGCEPRVRSKYESTFDRKESVYDKVLRDSAFALASCKTLRRVHDTP